MRICLQRSVPIQPKTSEILPKFCQKLATGQKLATCLFGLEHERAGALGERVRPLEEKLRDGPRWTCTADQLRMQILATLFLLFFLFFGNSRNTTNLAFGAWRRCFKAEHRRQKTCSTVSSTCQKDCRHCSRHPQQCRQQSDFAE